MTFSDLRGSYNGHIIHISYRKNDNHVQLHEMRIPSYQRKQYTRRKRKCPLVPQS